jgi:hypothetical protein
VTSRPLPTAILAVLALASCAPNMGEIRRTQLQSLVGLSEVDAIRALGVPNRTVMADGHKFLQWDQKSQTTYPGVWGYGWGPPWYGGVPPTIIDQTCQTMLDIENNRVLSWVMRGNGCY